MVKGTSGEAIQPALVLTWDGTIARVMCPYKCRRKIHRHGTTLPRPGFLNSRVAHCGADNTDHNRQYRLLFPFEDDETTQDLGLWWALDRENRCWRTLGWSVYDPDYENATDLERYSQELDENDREDNSPPTREPVNESCEKRNTMENSLEDLTQGLVNLDFDDTYSTRCRESLGTGDKSMFISDCVYDDEASARALLSRSSDPRTLIRTASGIEGKEIIHMVCEEGHLRIVELLLEFGAELETRDCEGNTPLLCAMNYGRLDLVSRLVQLGAETRVVDRNGESLADKGEQLLEHLELRRTLNAKTLDAPLEMPKYIPFEEREVHEVLDGEGKCVMTYIKDDGPFYLELPTTEEREEASAQLQQRDCEISRLKGILREYEIEEARLRVEEMLRKVANNHGSNQADHLRAAGTFDEGIILARIMDDTLKTPLESAWKTVACMSRGFSLPYTFAVSGLTPGTHGTRDGALDRTRWIDEVFRLARIVNYDLPADYRDAPGRPGSFNACHSEKQLLAYLIYNHTSAFLRFEDPDDILENLRTRTLGKDEREAWANCDAPSMKNLKVNIFVRQPARPRSWICRDCTKFCQKVAQAFDLRLDLHVINWGGGSELEHSFP